MKIERKEKNGSAQSIILQIPPIARLLNQNGNLEKKLVSIYKWVRDLPFKVNLNERNYHKDLMYIKIYEKGSCSSKHYLLGNAYENMGISVEYLTYPFYWHELSVVYPDFLKQLAEKMPLSYHLAIRTSIEEKKFILDATWDLPLKKAGFPINKIGSRLINTKIGVTPSGECIVHKNARERETFIAEINKKRERKISKENIEFYAAFNVWLEHLRKTKTE